MSKWIGYAVSVNCGEPLGCYQGTILEADGSTITLTKAFRNGFPYPKAQVTLKAADIKELKIIEVKGEEEGRSQTHSTVALVKSSKKCQRATVCENLQANPSSSGLQQAGVNTRGSSVRNGTQCSGPARSKPIEIQTSRSNRNTNNSGSYGGAGGGAGGGSGSAGRGGGAPLHAAARRRNEACFGSDAADPALDEEFDFEKNLALFDKRALWDQMRNSHKPDLVRSADEKYRHDENVLGGGGAGVGAGGGAAGGAGGIVVPAACGGARGYVSDEGVTVPSVCGAGRRALWDAVRARGALDAALLLLARAAADVALRLVGGGRRLDPRNAHQVPTVVALVGPHRMGACGVQTARLLASHGVRTAALVCGAGAGAAGGEEVSRELALYAQCGGAVATRAGELPSPDLVLLAVHDPAAATAAPAPRDAHHYTAALQWARASRAGVVCVEWAGGAGEEGGAVCARACVVALLPPALPPSPALGRLYLANVAPPHSIFRELGITYKPPFGAASVLALHPSDE